MLFYYIRHGDPTYDPDSLTPLGRRQAEAVGKRLAVHGIDKIFASSAERAKLTAKPLCEMLGMDMTVLDWCNEGHVWNELVVSLPDGSRTWAFYHAPTRALFRSKEMRDMGDTFYTHPAFEDKTTYGITQFESGLRRVQTGVDELIHSLGYTHDKARGGYVAEYPTDDRIALFAHQGFGGAFLSCLLDIPYPTFSTSFDLSHSSVTVIEFRAERGQFCVPHVLQLANDSHIYREGLPTKYNNEIYI